MWGGVGGMEFERKVVDFDKVFEVLRQVGFAHEETETVEACFKNWDRSVDFDREEVLAYLVRLILMDEAIKFSKRLEGADCDMRDILFVLVAKGMGLSRVSQLVEVAERGLKAFYDERDYVALSICFGMMLEKLEEKINEIEKTKGVMLQ